MGQTVAMEGVIFSDYFTNCGIILGECFNNNIGFFIIEVLFSKRNIA